MTDPIYCFHIKKNYTLEEAWELLEAIGLSPLYSVDSLTDSEKVIYVTIPPSLNPTKIPKIECVKKITFENLGKIDWDEQWKLHSKDYKDGYVNLLLNTYNPKFHSTIKLKPGPGFGDLSHLTTQLMLRQMGSLVKGRHVLDVGCGSGVLSLAASAMGAASTHGIDIDPLAVQHSQLNSRLNKLDATFGLPGEYSPKDGINSLIVLMNMIESEQKEAWNSLKKFHGKITHCIISGILADESADYLERWWNKDWTLGQEIIEGEWTSFYLQKRLSWH